MVHPKRPYSFRGKINCIKYNVASLLKNSDSLFLRTGVNRVHFLGCTIDKTFSSCRN